MSKQEQRSGKAKFPMLLEKQVVRVTKKGTLAKMPVGALGQIVHSGIGAKLQMWYGVRFLCMENPNGFMDITMWEGELRPLTKKEKGGGE